jgi:hypothetical protein
MSTLSTVRAGLSVVNPVSSLAEPLSASVISFTKSLRLAIEVSREIDNANCLTRLGRALLDVREV